MKFYTISLFFFLTAILMANYGCFTVMSNDNFTYTKADPFVYDSLLINSRDYYLIDVRTHGEFIKSHIYDAVNYSYLDFHFRKDVRNLNRNKAVFVYCQTCHRSPLAARKLKRMGFRQVYDLKGGYQKWIH